MAQIDLKVLANILLSTAKVNEKDAEKLIAAAFKQLNIPSQFVKVPVQPELIPDTGKLRRSVARLQKEIQAALASSPLRAQLPAPLNELSAQRLATISKALNRYYKLLDTPVSGLSARQREVVEGIVTTGRPATGREAKIAGAAAKSLERQLTSLNDLGAQLKGSAITQPVSKRLRETAENLQNLLTLVRSVNTSPEFTRALEALFTGAGIRKGAPPPPPPPASSGGRAGGGGGRRPFTPAGSGGDEPPGGPLRPSNIGPLAARAARVREGLQTLRGLSGLDRVVDLPARELHVVRTALKRNLERQQLALGRMIEMGVTGRPLEALKDRLEATRKAFQEIGNRLATIARTETQARQARTDAVKALRALGPEGIAGIKSREELRGLKNALTRAERAQRAVTERADLTPERRAREELRRQRLQRSLEQVQTQEWALAPSRRLREQQAERQAAARIRERTAAEQAIRQNAIQAMTALGPGTARERLGRVSDPVQLRTLEKQLRTAQAVQERRAISPGLSREAQEKEFRRAALFGQQLEAVRNRLKELGQAGEQLSKAQRKEAAAREKARRQVEKARTAEINAQVLRQRAIRSMTVLGPGTAQERLARISDPVQLRTLEQQLKTAQAIQARRATSPALSPERARQEGDRASLFGRQLEAVRNRLRELGQAGEQLSKAQRKEAAEREKARRQAEKARASELSAQEIRQRAIRSMAALGPGTARDRLSRVTDPVQLRMLEQQLTAARAVQTRIANAAGLTPQQVAHESRRAALLSNQLKAVQAQLTAVGQAPIREVRQQQRIADLRATAEPLRREAIAAVRALGPVSSTRDVEGLERAHKRLTNALQVERRLLKNLNNESQATREAQERQVRKLEGHLGRVRDQIGAIRREETALRRTQETAARRREREAPVISRADEGSRILREAGGLGAVSAIPREQLSLVREGLERQSRELRDRQAQLLSQMQSSGSTRQLRSELDQTNRTLRDTDQALRQVRDRMNGFRSVTAQAASTIRLFFRYAVGYGALYQVLGAVTALARGVRELDQQLNSIAAIARTTPQELTQIEAAIKRVATTTQFSVTEIAQAAQTLAQSGFGASEINRALESVALFASATNSALATSADLISTVRHVFKDLSDRTIADRLTTAVNISKLTADDLQTILSRGLQVSKGFNLTAEQFLSAVTVLRNAGIRASTVSTGLRQALLEVFSPSKQLVEVLKKRYRALGEELTDTDVRKRFFGFTQTADPMINALRELRRLGLGGTGQMDFARVFNVRAMNALEVMVKNIDQLTENTVRLGVGSGSALRGAERQMASFNHSLSNLGATIVTVSANLSEGLLPMLARGLQNVTSELKDLDATIDSIRGKSGAGIGSALAAGGAAGLAVAQRTPLGTFGRTVAGVASGAAVATGGVFALSQSPTKATQQLLEVIAWITGAAALLRGFRFGSVTTLGRDLRAAQSLGEGLGLIATAVKQFPILRVVVGITGLFAVLKRLANLGEETAKDREVQIIAGEKTLAKARAENESRRAVFSAFDPEVNSSVAEIARSTRRSFEEADRQLVRLFGDRAEAVRELVLDLSRVSDQASPQAKKLLAEIARTAGRNISEIEPRILDQIGHTLREATNVADDLASEISKQHTESGGRQDLRSRAFRQAFRDLGLSLEKLDDINRPVDERLRDFETLSQTIFSLGQSMIDTEGEQRKARDLAQKKADNLVLLLRENHEKFQEALNEIRSQYLTESGASIEDLALMRDALEREVERMRAKALSPAIPSTSMAAPQSRRIFPGMGFFSSGPSGNVRPFGHADAERLGAVEGVYKDIQQTFDAYRSQIIAPANNDLKRATTQLFDSILDALNLGGTMAQDLKAALEGEGFDLERGILPEEDRFITSPTTGKLEPSARLKTLRTLFEQHMARVNLQAEELDKFLLESIKDDPEIEGRLAEIEARIKMARRRKEFSRITDPGGLIDQLFGLRTADLQRRLREVQAQEELARTLPGATHEQRQRLEAQRKRLQGQIQGLQFEREERVDEATRAGQLFGLDIELGGIRNRLRLLDRDLSVVVNTGGTAQQISDLMDEQLRLKERELELERDRAIIAEDRSELAEATFATEKELFAAQRIQLLAEQLRQARQAEMERDLAQITTRADAFGERFGTGISRERALERLTAERDIRERAALRIFTDEIPKLEAMGDKATDKLMQSRMELARLRNEIDGLDGDIARLNQGMMAAFTEGFDATRIRNNLRQLDSSVENLAQTVSGQVVRAIDDLGNAFADAALEGKSFFGSMSELAHNFFKDLVRLFIRSEINALFSFATGGGGSIFSALFGRAAGSAKGSVIKAATGGIIQGPGTGTSDSIPGTVHDRRGNLRGLIRVSDGEAILNARAVKALGEETVHAINRVPRNLGRFAGGGIPGVRPRPLGTQGMASVSDMERVLRQLQPNTPTTVKVQLSEGALNRTLRDWLEEELGREAAFR